MHTTTSLKLVLGNVNIEGETYLITAARDGYEAIRVADRSCVGTVAGPSGFIWRVDSPTPELMHAIFEAAMVEGSSRPRRPTEPGTRARALIELFVALSLRARSS